VTPGGVECAGGLETLWLLVHRSRLAESVRLRLRPFRASSFAELERGFERLPWHPYLTQHCEFDVSVTTQGSRLYHTDAIAERLRGVVSAKWSARAMRTPLALRPTQESANVSRSLASHLDTLAHDANNQKVYVRVTSNLVQVSIDTSGVRLHRRGYRTHVGEAPLRETLAAAAIQLLLALTPNASVTRLWDPCCGSGTLLGEWLLRQSSTSPELPRTFAFEHWPIHDAQGYAAWLAQAPKLIATLPSCSAYGSDIDAKVIEAARHNLDLARVGQECALFAQDFRQSVQRVPQNTAVVANLPYGVRLQDRASAAQVFAELDRVLQRRPDLRPALVLTTLAPSGRFSARWRQIAEFANAGLRVKAFALNDAQLG